VPDVVVDGVAIHYDATPPRPGRVPLVLTHGYASSAHMWAANLDALGRDRQVITWDVRGHGASASPPRPEEYTRDASVADLAAVLDAAGAERAVVGGLSLGGYLSLAFALHHPERVTGLVLCDTGPGYKRDGPRAAWNRMVEATAAAWEHGTATVAPNQHEVLAPSAQSRRGLALAGRGLVAQHDRDVIDGLATIAAPALVVVGADDAPFRAAADYLATRLPRAELVVIPAAGHAVNLDQPAAFERAVLGFLSRLP
jgi:pimeloyl-ACP methyl ester carboxylesterase